MELVFLNREDLSVLDYGYVEKDYQIVIDSVIPQKSTFNVNKTDKMYIAPNKRVVIW